MSDLRAHWDSTYTAKAEDRVSWYQAVPEPSLTWIQATAPSRSAPIIDVGSGASRLVDALMAAGYRDLTALDVSEVALERTKARLGKAAEKVTWIVGDVTQWTPLRVWQVWHDRAVFHFLTERAAQDAYLWALTAGTGPGSRVIIAAFAPTGPERCSGLPVQRYSAAALAGRLGPHFVLQRESPERHVTPFGTAQDFTFAEFLRVV